MELSLGMVFFGNRVEWVLKLNKYLYGLNQESSNWFDLLKTGLERRGYYHHQVDPFVSYIEYLVILSYIGKLCNSLTQTRDNHIINIITK